MKNQCKAEVVIVMWVMSQLKEWSQERQEKVYLRNISDIADWISRKRMRGFGDNIGLLQNCIISFSEDQKTYLVKLYKFKKLHKKFMSSTLNNLDS